MRLSACQYFPSLDEGVKELIDSLIRVTAGDAVFGSRIIDRALKNERTCPTPADLEAIASELGTAGVPLGCEKCEGTGFRYTKKKVDRTALDEHNQPIVYETYEEDCQVRCVCELGRFLAAREVERKQMERSA